MKRWFTYVSLLCSVALSAQPGVWTWMHGSNTPNSAGNFGTLLTPSVTNDPPALEEAGSWNDAQGNLWVFGGFGPTGNPFSALWKFDPVALTWTWMHGPSTTSAAGVYGTQGVAAPGNNPGARASFFYWTDSNGNFWLFGGDGIDANGNPGLLSDLWKYDPLVNMWTWVNGPSTANPAGSYGTLGVPSPANLPPPRRLSRAMWTDGSNLYLFGGTSSAPMTSGISYNDLWVYSIATNMWTWVNGSNLSFEWSQVGPRGVFSSAYRPGSRIGGSCWTDHNGKFWLYGGLTNGIDAYSDLWEYDPATNQFAWINGTVIITQGEVLGTPCVADTNCYPRSSCAAQTWTDAAGNLWIRGMGDYAWIVQEFWYYNITTDEWALVGGNFNINDPGNYGTMNVALPTNSPPDRQSACTFTDQNGNLWLFGGGRSVNNTRFNDVWKFVPDYSGISCPALHTPLTAAFSANNSGCAPYTVTFTNNSINATSYSWDFGNAQTSTQANPSVTYASAGNYTVTLIASDSVSSDTTQLAIQVYAMPTAAIAGTDSICAGATAVLNASGGAGYSWSTGATTAQISVSPSSTTTYSVVASNNQCADTALFTVTVNPLPTVNVSGAQAICIGGSTQLTASGGTSYAWSTGQNSAAITVSPASTSTYTVTAFDGTCSDTAQITVVVYPYPVPFITGDTLICPGTSAALTASGGGTYQWSTGQNSAGILVNPSAATTYSVIVSNGYCSASDSVQVNVLPGFTVNAGTDDTILIGTSTALAATAGTSYAWSPSTGLSCTNCQSPTANPTVTTTYIVAVIDANGCTATDTVTVFVDDDCGMIFIPNAFSPNGDGQNDLLCVRGQCVSILQFSVFDRWGTEVFHSNDLSNCWDGTYHGQALENAVFTYTLQATLVTGTIISKHGNVSLVR